VFDSSVPHTRLTAGEIQWSSPKLPLGDAARPQTPVIVMSWIVIGMEIQCSLLKLPTGDAAHPQTPMTVLTVTGVD